jgi:hypothetical protein
VIARLYTRHQRVDGFDAGLQRLSDALPIGDARGHALNRRAGERGDRPFPVERLSQGIHDAADQRLTNWHRHHASGASDTIVLPDTLSIAKQDHADGVLVEVEGHPEQSFGECHHLAGHRLAEPAHPGDVVADREDGTDVGRISGRPGDLVADDTIAERCLSRGMPADQAFSPLASI